MSAAPQIQTTLAPLTLSDVMKNQGVKQKAWIEQCEKDGVKLHRSAARALMLFGIWPTTLDCNAVMASLQKLFTQPLNKEEQALMLQPEQETAPKAYLAKQILEHYGIAQTTALHAITANGVKCSRTTLNMFLNNGYCPKGLTPLQLKEPIEQLLMPLANQEEIDTLWHLTDHKPAIRGIKDKVKRATPEQNNNKTTVIFDQLEPEMLYRKTMNHFHLCAHPFENEIQQVDDLFMSQNHMRVREAMVQTATRGGILAVIGECGAGKSEVRKGFYDYVNNNHPELVIIEPMVIDKRRLTASMIFDALADELNIKNMPRSLEDRARAVERQLKRSSKGNNRHVLVIEEAHDLTNDAFKHLKRICELTDGFNRLVSVILVGQPELEAKLAYTNYDIREFSYRCNVMMLPPLGLELHNYIAHKFNRINVNYKNVVTDDGVEAIRNRLTGQVKFGIAKKSQDKDMTYPLMVNTILVKAMNLAASLSEPHVTPDVIAEIK
ncbi:hypothetical protein tloyanaT_25910 [Thalassotalea loyana]|uniref:ORC1/DEAH AAA+ ATPase domain-containing protein n=2 Tax=Thalassotalea loyana TaxID=280483 RepID=A0ABQ6HE29_9GAMM|nr:hypothetical protein tloyanaT_25910 [Thalassotalea loyana]